MSLGAAVDMKHHFELNEDEFRRRVNENSIFDGLTLGEAQALLRDRKSLKFPHTPRITFMADPVDDVFFLELLGVSACL